MFYKTMKKIYETAKTDEPYTPATMANLLEMPLSSYYRKAKLKKLPYEKIVEYCVKNNVSIDMILCGKEEEADTIGIRALGLKGVPVINIDKNILEISPKRTKSNNLIAVKVSGDSMMPDFGDGTIVIAEKCNLEEVSGGLYVIPLGNNIYSARKIERSPKGGYMLMSSNPRYSNEHLQQDQIKILGKIKLILRAA